MTSSMGDLYQGLILEHNRAPRNYRRMDDATRNVEGYNPLCGDQVTVFVKVDEGVVQDVSFQGSGCAISRASASLMTQAVKGRSVVEAQRLFEGFHRLMTDSPEHDASAGELGKLAALSGVRRFPMRVKCATLAWHALRAALQESVTSGVNDAV